MAAEIVAFGSVSDALVRLTEIRDRLSAIRDSLPVDPATGFATEATLAEVAGRQEFPWSAADRDSVVALRRGISDARILLDYAGRADSLPVFVGKAAQGTAAAAPTWSIQFLTYDGSNRLIDAQVLTGAWDERSTLGWA